MGTVEEARTTALKSAEWDLQGLYSNPTQELLDPSYRETADCWMFFQCKDIAIPPERSLSRGAYAISKHSMEERFVPDFRDDEVRLREYLQLLSDHFAKAGPTAPIAVPDPNA